MKRQEIMAHCKHHGWTVFVDEKKNPGKQRRCRACRRENAVRHHRAIKRTLVAEHGGLCIRCGYDRCEAALHFHHIDTKVKALSTYKSLKQARIEASKCLLLCANCHVEIDPAYGD